MQDINDTDPHIGVLAAFYFGVKVPNSSKQFFKTAQEVHIIVS
jgi:hypothetical protein